MRALQPGESWRWAGDVRAGDCIEWADRSVLVADRKPAEGRTLRTGVYLVLEIEPGVDKQCHYYHLEEEQRAVAMVEGER